MEDFTIGTEDCESKKKSSGYCNGPLKAGATYSVKVRAFTARDKFTDTHYSFRIQTGTWEIKFILVLNFQTFLYSTQIFIRFLHGFQ